MDLLGQRTHCGPNVAAPNPRQPCLGDFTADGLDQLTLCSQSPGFGTPAAPVQTFPYLQVVTINSYIYCRCSSKTDTFGKLSNSTKNMDIPNHMKNLNPLKLVRHILDCTLRGDFMANGLEQLTLCSSRLASVHRQHLCSQCTLCPATCIELADILDPWVVHAVDDVVQHPSDPTTTWRPNFGKAAIQLSHLYENF
ncbi:hypothetical protein STEG23_015716 [Scotinomys teguina]